MNKRDVLDRYFLEHRAKLIDIAAFLDRLERAEGQEDFRAEAFRQALRSLDGPDRAKGVLLSFSDPGADPIDSAAVQGATGAHDPGTG